MRTYPKYIVLVAAILASTGCGSAPTTVSTSSTTTVADNTTAITYFVNSAGDTAQKFCNGDDMNSAGYKASLTKEVDATVPGKLSTLAKIKTTLTLAANDSFFANSGSYTLIDQTEFSDDGTVTMRLADAWAGVSIFECSWHPFVERQLESIPEVKKIVWVQQR